MRNFQGTIILFLTILLLPVFCFGQREDIVNKNFVPDSINNKIDFLTKYFFENNSWHVTDSDFVINVAELINFIKGQPVDTILKKLSHKKSGAEEKLIRYPDKVSDSLNIPGFIPRESIEKRVTQIEKLVLDEFSTDELEIPVTLLSGIEEKVKIIPPGQGEKLLTDSIYYLPDSLNFLDVIPESMIQTPEDFQRFLHLDSIRDSLIENFRTHYNDSLIKVYRDSLIYSFRREKIRTLTDSRLEQFIDSVKINNYNVLRNYNDSIVSMINDSINTVLNDLIFYANNIDTTQITIYNLKNEPQELLLRNNADEFVRVWLKNEQNDSISVLVRNVDKKSMKILIDDNITISRISKQETKEFDFSALTSSESLKDIRERYKIETPWSIGGDGTIGFTQTYLNNWSKGGKSAVSMLLVLKGFANYSTFDNKLKWENSVEIRNGWLKPGGTNDDGNRYEFQKNDDKFELISRIGISAFKKWYYSAEIDFETQFFNGYKYPTSTNPDPISAFLSPGKILFKLGLDYKPNKNFSVFLSPITSKTVFVIDTVKINKSTYNIPDGKKRLWVPGLNADIKFKTDITPDISYETKYKMFINYTKPFEKFDVNWENLLVMKVNNYIDIRFMLHLIYDDDVLFEIKDANNNVIDKKPKLQVKELITVGFSYKINKKVFRTRQLEN